MMKILPVVTICFFCISCANSLHQSQAVDPIVLCTSYNGYTVNDGFQKEIDLALEQFIVDHNTSKSAITLMGCDSKESYKVINFMFDSVVYVSKEKNIAATAVNFLGLIVLPIGMVTAGSEFFIGIYFQPTTQTMMRVKMSQDLKEGEWPELPTQLRSIGYLKSVDKQNIKQGEGFYRTLKSWFKKFEKQYIAEHRELSEGYNRN